MAMSEWINYGDKGLSINGQQQVHPQMHDRAPALERENVRLRAAVISALEFLDMVAVEPSKPGDDSQLMASLMGIRAELRHGIESR